MNIVPNPICGSCKCYWKPDETDIKSSGLVCKSCKKCRQYKKESCKKYREENPDKRKEYRKKYYEENPDKIKEYLKKYYEENADKIKEASKKYHENNADKIKEYRKKYRENNADKIKEYKKKYYEENKCMHGKRQENCKICNKYLYLVNLQRHQINRCFKNSNLKKTKPSISYLDCSAEYFNEYFEKKMDLWNEHHDVKMTWDNIHIDHIKPINAFNLDDEEEFLKCCHYTNMQPLLAEDNLSKRCKWSNEDNKYWCDNIIYKEYLDIYIPV